MKTTMTFLTANLLFAIAAFGQAPAHACNLRSAMGEVSLNGTILPWTHDTRANDPSTVNPDCTGSVTYEITIAGQPAPDAHFEFVIVDNGSEIKGFPVDQGYAVSCQLINEK